MRHAQEPIGATAAAAGEVVSAVAAVAAGEVVSAAAAAAVAATSKDNIIARAVILRTRRTVDFGKSIIF